MKHTEQSYRQEWATLTGRAERDVYVPKDLREESDSKPSPTPPDVKDRGTLR